MNRLAVLLLSLAACGDLACGGPAPEAVQLGLANLRADPERFRRSEPGNGWGTYEQLVTFVEGYLHACEADPDASVRASR